MDIAVSQTSTEPDAPVILTPSERRIDAAVAIRFKDRMRELTSDGPPRVILDLSHVDFIDSSGLGAIVAALKQMQETRKLELAGLTGNVAKVFRLTRMDSVFRIHGSAAEAVAAPTFET